MVHFEVVGWVQGLHLKNVLIGNSLIWVSIQLKSNTSR